MDLTELKRQQAPLLNRHPWEMARARIIRFLLRSHSSPPWQHLLEIGSGDAFILRQLAADGSAKRYSALDNAYDDASILSLQESSPGQKINYYSDSNSLASVGRPADVILLPDVLEHCEDDANLWSFAMNDHISTPGSICCVTVPAYQQLFSDHDKLLHHYRRYNRTALVALCKKQQVTILQSGYFFFSLWVTRWLQVFFQKAGIRTSKKSIDNWKGNKLTTSFISFILWMDFRACLLLSKMRITLPGLSAYCLCKKLP